MTTLLYHARTIGYVCDRIAALSDNRIMSICDKLHPVRVAGAVIRWDSRAPLEADAVINTAEAVKLSRHKKHARMQLEGLCPQTWYRLRDAEYPCLIRPQHHYGAQKFFICNNVQQAHAAVAQCGHLRYYASPIIDKELEYRVFVFQGYAMKVVRRYHENPAEVAWNIANGGKSVRVKHDSWPIPVVQKAIEAGQRLGLGWYAADVIVDKQGTAYVLELNTAPGLDRDKTLETCADLFAWAGEHEAPAPAEPLGDSWQMLLHPALL